MFTLNNFTTSLFKLNLTEMKYKFCLNMKKINYNHSLYNNNKKSFSFFKRTVQKLRNRNYNFYEVLGVERECTNDQIRAAYLKLAKQYHPDINKDPGSDEKFKTITLAYEALSNQRNRDLYDAYMNNDPYSSEWKYKEEMYRDDQQDSTKNFYKERAKYDKYSENYKHQDESNFWKGNREDFTKDFYKDFENIFTNTPGTGYHKSKKDLKADDVLIEITILFEDSFFGAEKGVSFDRIEKCKSCNGYRSERGHRPSRCFTCNGIGEIKTSMFNSKKCNQCKGTGVLIKYPCKECDAKGVKSYKVDEIIPIPRGIVSGSNIRIEKKGNSGDSADVSNGDLLVKVNIENKNFPKMKRVADDIIYNLDIELVDAIFGCTKEIQTIDNKIEIIEVKPGSQSNDKITYEKRGFVNPDNSSSKRGNLIINYDVKIPNLEHLNNTKKDEVKNYLNSVII